MGDIWGTSDGGGSSGPVSQINIPFSPAGTYDAMQIGPNDSIQTSRNSSNPPLNYGTWNLWVPDNPSTNIAGLAIQDATVPSNTNRSLLWIMDHNQLPLFWVNGLNMFSTDPFFFTAGFGVGSNQIVIDHLGTFPGWQSWGLGMTLQNLATPTGASATLAAGGTLTSGTTYYYTVTAALFQGQQSISCAQVSATPTAGNQSITVAWTRVPGAAQYFVYRSTVSNTFNTPCLYFQVFEGFQTSTAYSWTDNGSATAQAGAPLFSNATAQSFLHIVRSPSSSPATTPAISILNEFAGELIGCFFDGHIEAASGAVGTPTYTFSADNTTGLYLSSTGNWAMASGGVRVLNASSTLLNLGNTSVGVSFGFAATALGGGATPTLGTIGGSGPATAAQNSWLKVTINGATAFIPVWH